MSTAIIRVLHIIFISFLGGFAYSIRKKSKNSNIQLKQMLTDTFVNGVFGLAIGMFVATYSDNQYFILSLTTLASLYGDKIIILLFKND